MSKDWKKRIGLTVLIIALFVGCRYVKYLFALIVGKEEWNASDENLRGILITLVYLLSALLCSWATCGKVSFRAVGFRGNVLKGLLWGFVFTIPMFIGYAATRDFNSNLDSGIVIRDMIRAGFGEEIIFRGFLFGLLFYYAGWGFFPAALLAGLFFGAGHLYQAEDFSSALSIFVFTTLASAGFAWFYVAWRSLWMVIFLHGFMDLAWDMFTVDTNVTGNASVNLYRFLTLGLAIAYSVVMVKRDPSWSMKGRLWLNLKPEDPLQKTTL